MSYITFDQVCKDYGQGEQVVHAADHVSFGIEQGELCVVLGPSGCGQNHDTEPAGWHGHSTSGETLRGGQNRYRHAGQGVDGIPPAGMLGLCFSFIT